MSEVSIDERVAKSGPTQKDRYGINSSCPQCDVDQSYDQSKDQPEEMSGGKWLGTVCTIMLFCWPAFGQAAYSGLGLYSGAASYGVSVGGATTSYAALPQQWVDNNELTCGVLSSCYTGSPGLALTKPAYELALPGTWVSGPPSGCTFNYLYGGNQYWPSAPTAAQMGAGYQQAIIDLEACRHASSGSMGFILDRPPGLYITANSISIPQSSSTMASSAIIVRSTVDSTLVTMGEPVGAGGIQDNLSESTAPGLNNPDLTGTNMYFENGPANASGVLTGITTVSVNTTTLAAINVSASAQLVPLVNGYLSPTLGASSPAVTIDTGSNQETVTPVSGVNQVGIYAVFLKSHSAGACVVYNVTVVEGAPTGCGNGTGTFTLANGTPTTISNYNYLQYMYVDECTGSGCLPMQLCGASPGSPMQCAGSIGPDHWEFMDGVAAISPGNTSNNDIIYTGNAATATAMPQFATHIHFRRYAALGDWTSLGSGMNSIADGFDLNGCEYCSLVGSQVSQVLRPGGEGHAVLAQGTTYKIDNDWFEGQSIGIFAGGFSAAPVIATYNPFSDAQVGRVRLTFPYSWLGLGTIPSNNSRWSGQSLVRKNCSEFKQGERVFFYGIICENDDISGGQNGVNFSIDVRSISGVPTGQNYFATIQDVTVQQAVFRNSCNGIEVVGRSSGSGSGDGVSYPMTRIDFNNILHYNISNTNPNCNSDSFGMYLTSGGQLWEVTVTQTTATTATAVAICSVDGGDCPSGPPSIGYQVFNMPTGHAVYISGCTSVTGFNMPTQSVGGSTAAAGIGPGVSNGSAAWTGSFNSAGVTVTYPWNAAANGIAVGAVDSTGSCNLTNIQGNPQYLTINHNLLITDSIESVGIGPAPTPQGPNFQENHIFANSIFLSNPIAAAGHGGSFNTSVKPPGEGTNTENFNYDASTMSAFKLVWPGRTNTYYTEYGNNPSYSDANGCTGAGCNPPNATGMYFPATSCDVGFSYACTGNLPLNLADWHSYALSSGSPYHNAGSDGMDIGAIFSGANSIDAGQTTVQYVCTTPCGSPGPFPD